VSVWIIRSALVRPRKSQTSPVAAVAIASSKGIVLICAGTPITLGLVKIPWKLLGVAGVAGVAATGVVVARHRREEAAVDPDELRSRLHERLEAARAAGDQQQPM
jgi:hypothetical protein